MRLYIYIGIAAAVLTALAFGYSHAYMSGKDSIVTKLQKDKIVVLKNNQVIDEKTLAADDDSLTCMLIDCAEVGK